MNGASLGLLALAIGLVIYWGRRDNHAHDREGRRGRKIAERAPADAAAEQERRKILREPRDRRN